MATLSPTREIDVAIVEHLRELADELVRSHLERSQSVRVKGKFATAAAEAFDLALDKYGVSRRHKAVTVREVLTMDPKLEQQSVAQVYEAVSNDTVIESSMPLATAERSVDRDGAAIRTAVLASLTCRGAEFSVLPITLDAWLSLDVRTRDDVRRQWLQSERADWENRLQAQVMARPDAGGKFVAIGNGQVVGLYDNEDEAVDASLERICEVVGPIGVYAIRRIPVSAVEGGSAGVTSCGPPAKTVAADGSDEDDVPPTLMPAASKVHLTSSTSALRPTVPGQPLPVLMQTVDSFSAGARCSARQSQHSAPSNAASGAACINV